MFTGTEIKKHVRKQPFVPFRLVTSAGESFDILHPELIMVGSREVTIGMPNPADPSVYEDQVWVAMLHISSIRELPLAPSTSNNGQASGS